MQPQFATNFFHRRTNAENSLGSVVRESNIILLTMKKSQPQSNAVETTQTNKRGPLALQAIELLRKRAMYITINELIV